MTDEQMIKDILAELKRARKKFPENRHQLTAFNEEVGELNQALLQCQYGGKGHNDVYMEAVQAAAMAIRVGVEGDSTFNYNSADVHQRKF